jgi:hypothetical protein
MKIMEHEKVNLGSSAKKSTGNTYPKDLNIHSKDTIPKIQNKYSQKRNCPASAPTPTFMFCELFIYFHDRSAYSAAGK